MEDGEDTGVLVPKTEFRDRNTIKDALKAYLAYNIAVPATVNRALDLLFTTEVILDMVGRDGIAYGLQSPSGNTKVLVTTLNDGGDNTKLYTEFYGYLTGAATLSANFILGHNLQNAGADHAFTTEFAYYAVSASVAASRRYHFYWKITLS